MVKPTKVKFVNKKGIWVEETCHDITTCREHKEALARTKKFTSINKNSVVEIEEDLEANSLSLNEYNNHYEDDATRLHAEIMNFNGKIPKYITTSIADLVYHMDDVTFYNQNENSDEEELTLGDIYRNPQLIDENQTEMAELVHEEFALFSEEEGYHSEVYTQSYGTSEHSVLKVVDPAGGVWVADFNARFYDEEKPFPWVLSFEEWDSKIDSVVQDLRFD